MAVTISYKNSKISEINNSNTKTLETAGKYCESNIIVNYNKEGNKIVEGNSSIVITDAEEGDICALTQYGACEQDSSTNAISCNNGVLSISSGEIITTGTNETVTVGSQTATIENLYSVGNIKDEQEIVTGRVIRKNDICIYDGTQSVGDRYISSTGAKDNGAIIIYPREEEYNSEDMVSFSKNTEEDINSLEVSITPIQDLNGYSNPRPAGGGINKAKVVYKTISAATGYSNLQDNSVTVYSSSTTAAYRYGQFALLDAAGYAGQTLTFTAKAQQVTGSSTPRILGRLYDSNGSLVGSTIFEKTGTSITHTFTLPATIDSGVTFRVLLYCNSGYAEATETNFYDIQVEVGSTAHDFAPYANICPITGRTGVDLYKVGHELISIPQYSETKNGCTLTVVDESTIRISGTPSSGVRFVFPLSTNTDFEFNQSTMRFYINDSPPTGISVSVSDRGPNGGYQNFSIRVKTTFGGDTADISIHLYAKDDESNVSEAYQEDTYSVDWGYQFNVNDATDIGSGTNKKLSVNDGLLTITATGAVSTTSIVTTSALSSVIENATLPAGIYCFRLSDFSATVTGATLDSIKLTITTNGVDTVYSRNVPIVLTSESTIKNIVASTTLEWNSGNIMQFRIIIDSSVYGGKLNVVTGALTVEWASVDMGSLSWSRNAAYNVMYAYVAGKANGRGNLICSNYKTVELYYEYLSSGEISGALTNNAINVKDDAYTSAADFKAAMSGVQLCYELATPITYQLTPQEVQTLVGQNNIFSPDATSIKVAVSNPRIEQVTPQPFTLNFGNNTISANNLSVSSVPLKITYNAHVTAGTPVASKGTVTNNSITVTPSVTNVTGYITGGTIVGTPVTVDVTELESGTKTITENGTGISVSGYSTVDVNVSSGSSWDLLTSDEFTVSTTSTTKTTVGTIDLSAYIPSFNKGDILWFHIRDKAGPRNGYFYGSDCFFVIVEDGTSPSNANPPCYIFKYKSDAYDQTTGSYGLYCYNVSTIQYTATINARYSSTYSLAIDGTFKVDVYKLKADSSMTMFQ